MEKRYLLGLIFISCFLDATENTSRSSYVLEKAKEQFGTRMSVDTYSKLEKALIFEAHCKDHCQLHAASKSGNTLLAYSVRDGAPYFDTVRVEGGIKKLKKRSCFQHFAWPVLTSIKVWSQNLNIKVPKSIIDIILKYGYDQDHNGDYHYTDYDYHSDAPPSYMRVTLGKHFPAYHASRIFVNDHKNVVMSYKDEDNNNIIYVGIKNNINKLIVPKDFHQEEFLRVNSEICKKGTIEKGTIQDVTVKQALYVNPYPAHWYKTESLEITELRKEECFRVFAFPVIASIKILSKNFNIKVPKPIVDIFLKGAYQRGTLEKIYTLHLTKDNQEYSVDL